MVPKYHDYREILNISNYSRWKHNKLFSHSPTPHTHIPLEPRKCHIFIEFKYKMLISIGQFYNANMTATYTAKKPYTKKKEELALEENISTKN